MNIQITPELISSGFTAISVVFFFVTVVVGATSMFLASKIISPISFTQSATINFFALLANLLPINAIYSVILLLFLIRLIGKVKIFFDGILIIVIQMFVMVAFSQMFNRFLN